MKIKITVYPKKKQFSKSEIKRYFSSIRPKFPRIHEDDPPELIKKKMDKYHNTVICERCGRRIGKHYNYQELHTVVLKMFCKKISMPFEVCEPCFNDKNTGWHEAGIDIEDLIRIQV